MNYRDISYPSDFEYRSDGDHVPLEFYLQVLPISKTIYLKLGYFSSKAIQVLAYGFAKFIYNGGVIKIVTNHYLYEIDKELIDLGEQDCKELLGSEFKNELKWIYEALNDEAHHFINCLKYLVKEKRLEIIPVILKPHRMTHYKQGMFTDGEGNKVLMDGSCNFTARGLLENGETISVYRSWGSEFEAAKVKSKSEEIEKLANKKNESYEYLLKEQIHDLVEELGEEKTITELINEEIELVHEYSSSGRIRQLLDEYKSKLQDEISEFANTPRFPEKRSPRKYQIQAYENWVANNRQGVFAMATGTGKTITALYCVLREYERTGYYQAIILVPTKILVDQWRDEVSEFNYKNIVLVSSEYAWKKDFSFLRATLAFDKAHSFIVIVTYSTFSTENFQELASSLPESTLMIADEAHNIGSPQLKKLLPKIKFRYRLALSATPRRIYDEEGNVVIEKYFNSKEPYTFSFSMERAIREGYLNNYYYYPHKVSLNENEMEEYVEISRKLAQYFDSKTNRLKKDPIVERLLLARKRIIHKAENKLEVFGQIVGKQVSKYGRMRWAFVYVPEGQARNSENLLLKFQRKLEQKAPGVHVYDYTSNTVNKKEIMEHFEGGDIDVLVSMKCLDEGVDVPRAELAIFCSSTGNPRQFIQRRGRVLRNHPDKKHSIIHDLVVVPAVHSEAANFKIERSLMRSELTRVVYFASLALNYYEAMETCSELANLYNLSMYALELELKEAQ